MENSSEQTTSVEHSATSDKRSADCAPPESPRKKGNRLQAIALGIRAGRLAISMTLACLIALASAQLAARAADGTAQAPVGGLMFAPDPAIEFDAETVSISSDRITASYVLRNRSDQDRDFLIALRLPDVQMVDIVSGELRLPAPDAVNFIQFEANVEGNPVDATWEQRALAIGLDVSQTIRGADLSLGPNMAEMADAVAALSPELRRAMTKRGILQIEDETLQPAWILQTTFYWTQFITAGEVLTVEVTYKPVIGRSPYTPERLEELKDRYCIDDKLAQSIRDRSQRGGGVPQMTRVTYLLTQGAHWSKPTRTFRLILEKADPTVIAATCLDGSSPAGPNKVQWRESDFVPNDDVEILFVR